jgi:hypothetical protein
MPPKEISKARLAKMLEDRRRSFPARIEAHARSVLLQREVRQRMMQHLRDAERHHIGQSLSPMGENDAYLTRMRRELILGSLR